MPGLIFHPAAQEIKYSYFHALPPEALSRHPVRVFVYLHNNPDIADYSELENHLKTEELPRVLELCKKYKYTLLAPVIPATAAADADRQEVMTMKIIKNFMYMLKMNGYIVHPKIFISGFGAQGVLANRLAIFYPDLIHAVSAGNTDYYMLPAPTLGDIQLNYPYGTSDIANFQPNNYSIEAFKKINFFIFNSATTSSSLSDSDFLSKTMGNTPEQRAQNYAEFLTTLGVQTKFEKYPPETGTEVLTEEAVKFFDTVKILAY